MDDEQTEIARLKQQYATADLRNILQAVRQYVQTGCEALVCLVSIAGAIYAATRQFDDLALLLALVPSLWMVRQMVAARRRPD